MVQKNSNLILKKLVRFKYYRLYLSGRHTSLGIILLLSQKDGVFLMFANGTVPLIIVLL